MHVGHTRWWLIAVGLCFTTLEPLSRRSGSIGSASRCVLIVGVGLQLAGHLLGISGSTTTKFAAMRLAGFTALAGLVMLLLPDSWSLASIMLVVCAIEAAFDLVRALKYSLVGWILLGMAAVIFGAVKLGVSDWWLRAAIVAMVGGAVILGATKSDAKPRCMAGAVLLVLGVAGLTTLDVSATFIFVGLIVTSLLTGIVVTSRNPSILVLPLTIALIATMPIRDEPLPKSVAPSPGDRYFVVLGDSYISGEGADVFIEGTNSKTTNRDHSNECRRSMTAWPMLLAAHSNSTLPSHVLDLACSGSVTENINTLPQLHESGKHVGEQIGPAQLALYKKERDRLGLGSPEFVIVSIGGNDAGFGELASTCLGPGSCADVGTSFFLGESRKEPDAPAGRIGPGEGKPEAVSFIEDDLTEAYENIRREFGNIPVLVALYPDPVAVDKGACQGILLDTYERALIEKFTGVLNLKIASTAEAFDFTVLWSTALALQRTRNRLCDTKFGVAGLNFLAINPTGGSYWDLLNPKNWVHNSLHPNASGHRLMAEAVFQQINGEALKPTIGRTTPATTSGSMPEETTLKVWKETKMSQLISSSVLPMASSALGLLLLWSALGVTLTKRGLRWTAILLVVLVSFLTTLPFVLV